MNPASRSCGSKNPTRGTGGHARWSLDRFLHEAHFHLWPVSGIGGKRELSAGRKAEDQRRRVDGVACSAVGVFSPWNKDRSDFAPGLSCGPCTLSKQHTGSLRCACAFNMSYPGTFLVVQWLRLRASTPEDTGSAPGWESSTCPTVWSKSKKKKKEVKIFYKDLLYSTGSSA